jgi:short-subunit dehydrogenase
MDRLQALTEAIRAAGGEALAVPVDISNRSEVELMVKTVIDVYGRIDILFNNAGFGRLDWLENLDPDRDIETQVDVNLTGLMQVTRAVLPFMQARRSGHIINMSSVAGYIAAPLYTVYAATKYGVRGFTDALRREVMPFGIKVSGIYPGPAETEFGQHTGKSPTKQGLKLPKWLSMSSGHAARRVVAVAKHPRRALILPWYYRVPFFFDAVLPGAVDWFLKVAFVNKFHKPDRS